MATARMRSAGHAIVEQLVEHGVTRVYGVPGESYLDVLDGLYEYREQIDTIVTRQEGGAAMMAAAYGQVTGKPGVAMVTRGPGATNASIGVHIASQDASPMVLFIGQIPTGFGIEAELTIAAPGIDRELLQTLVDQAHVVCPYSNATRGNIDVTLLIAD